MEIFINSAILHIADNSAGVSHISKAELDIDSDACYEFIEKHVKKLLNNPAAKDAVFKADSVVLGVVNAFKNGELYFKEAAAEIGGRLADLMLKHADIPPADIVVVQFETRYKGKKKAEGLLDTEYLAVLKLNYKAGFTHQQDADGVQIVKMRTVLPFESGKVEEACLIPYDPMIVKLVEKAYGIDGEQTNYFSELFLECEPELSKKEVAEAIAEIAEEINDKYFGGSVEAEAKLKVALLDEAIEEEGDVSLFNVAARAFGENEEARSEFVALSKEAGIKPDVALSEKFLRQQFGTQKFKATNGVEIKFPAELSDDKNAVEFVPGDDGSVTVILKGLRKA